jgi:hypothetical protein
MPGGFVSIATGGAGPSNVVEQRGADVPSILHLVRPAVLLDRPSLGMARNHWSPGSDAGVLACRATIRATPQFEHKVIVLGGMNAGERCAQLGLRAAARIAPAFGRAELAGPCLTGWLRTYGLPRVIQGWGAEFGGLRGRVGAGRVSWCVADMESGALDSRLDHWPPVTSAMTPWLGTQSKRMNVRQAPRDARGGLRVVLIGDPPGTADAMAFTFMVGIMHVAGFRATAVLPRGATQLDRALRHVRGGGYVHRVEVVEGSTLVDFHEYDLGVSLPVQSEAGQAPGEPSFANKLCITAAAEAGLPVIMLDTPWARGLLPAGAHGCLSSSLEPAKMAKVAAALVDGTGLRDCRAALGGGITTPVRSLTTEVAQAWGIGAAVGGAR